MSRAGFFICAAISLTGCWPTGFEYLAPFDSGETDASVADTGVSEDASDSGAAIGPIVDRIALSGTHACARTRSSSDGQPTVHCWGKLRENAGGSELSDNASRPVVASSITNSAVIERMALGDSFGCYTVGANNSELRCWGSNTGSVLGRDSMTTASSATPLRALESTGLLLNESSSFAVGSQHVCALDQSKLLWCWGANGSRQLGRTTMDLPTQFTMFPVPAGNLLRVAAGAAHTCIESVPSPVTPAGGGMSYSASVFCFGERGVGQTGYDVALHGASVEREQPVWVDLRPASDEGFTRVDRLAAGASNTCVILRNQSSAPSRLYCWGDNTTRQLSTAMAASSALPVLITSPESPWDVREVAIGQGHICALAADPATPTNNQLWCWGSNALGQLGRSLRDPSDLPLRVQLPAPPTAVAAAGSTTCAIAGDKLYCWGSDSNGLLGIGGNGSEVTTPTEVTFR